MRGFGASLIVFLAVTVAATFGLRLIESVYGLAGGAIQWHHFGPLVGAAVTALVVPATSRPDPPEPVARRQWIAHTLLGVGAAVLFSLLLMLGFTLLDVPAPDLSRAGFGTIVIAMLGLLVGAFAQEVGWRGFLQPTLETRTSRLWASIVVGLVWTLWHVTAYTDLVTVALLLGSYLPMAVLLGHLGNGSVVQRVATTTLVHWLVTVPVMLMAGIGGSVVQAVVAVASICVTAVFMVMFFIATKRREARAR